MKKILFLIILFSFSLAAFGQTPDTTFISINQEEGVLERPRFIDQYDYLFGTKQPTRLLVKLNLVPVVLPLGENAFEDAYSYYADFLSDFASISKAELGLEWKVLPAWSLYAGGLLPTRGSAYFKGYYRGSGWRIEPRWYYEMPRRIRAGQSANNVSGNYFGIEYQTFAQHDRPKGSNVEFQRYNFQSLSLRYGLQRRLGRFGFIDASLGAGYQQASIVYLQEYGVLSSTDEGLFLETRVAAGLAFGAPRAVKSKVPFCDVLRCFQEDRHLWKISMNKAFRINQTSLTTNPKVAYEQKIGSSSFSIETEAEFFLNASRDFGDKLQVEKYGMGINVQPRWYFLQKHRIIKGKSGNNLAGIFGGMMAGYRRTNYNNSYRNPDLFYFAPHLGIQQRLFRNGFINYKFGVVYSDLEYGISEPSSFLSELQVGFAF